MQVRPWRPCSIEQRQAGPTLLLRACTCPLPALQINLPLAAGAAPPPVAVSAAAAAPLLAPFKCAGLHSLPVELIEDIALQKAEAENMRLEFEETSWYRNRGCSQRRVVLERAMNSPVVTLTRQRREARKRHDGAVDEVEWSSSPTVYLRARLGVVQDMLHLAMEEAEIMSDEHFPFCKVSFQVGGERYGSTEVVQQDPEWEGPAADERHLQERIDAWAQEQRDAALAHPKVARMLRVLCENSAL